MTGRFNKTNVALDLYTRYIMLQNKHFFTKETGYAQVQKLSTATQVAYGQWDAYGTMLDCLGLWDFLPDEAQLPKYTGPLHNGTLTKD